MTNPADAAAATVARQEIEYLRRHYAYATDLLCEGTPEALAEGRVIYKRIFTPDVAITAGGADEISLSAKGPENWLDVVVQALAVHRVTQHLIGTQVVEIESLPDSSRPDRGRATLRSHLQAWHEGRDGTLDIFIGTYYDEVRFVPGAGWQIARMHLQQVSREIRKLSG